MWPYLILALALVLWLRCGCWHRRHTINLGLSACPLAKFPGGCPMPIQQDLTAVEDLLVTVNPTDAAGGPSVIQAGSLAGVSNTADIIANGVVVDPTIYGVGNSGTEALLFVTTGTTGSYEVVVSADADPGDGVVTISDTVSGTVSHALASNLGLGTRGVPKKV